MLPGLPGQTQNAVPPLMNFQGRLARPDGTPVVGNTNLQLSIYNAATGGTLLWTQTFVNTSVRNGVFAVALNFASGYQNGATQSSLFGASAVYLEIAVNGVPQTPRQLFATVAYAFKANSVRDGSITSASIADGTITAADFAPNFFNPLTWLLNGNSGMTSGFLGTTDNKPLEFRANGHRAMRYSYAENTTPLIAHYRSINILGGSEVNSIADGVVGATIAGGGKDYFDLPDVPNRVMADFGTVGGGANNIASGPYSTVPGGNSNTAAGDWSFAAGYGAEANHRGSFVWSDGTVDFGDTAAYQFLIHAASGVGINTNAPTGVLHIKGTGANAEVKFGDTGGNAHHLSSARDLVFNSANGLFSFRSAPFTNLTTYTDQFTIASNGNATLRGTLTQNSDARWKQHIVTFPNALDAILNLRGVAYEWKPKEGVAVSEGRQIGFIAQEVERVLPELVMTDSNGYKSVAYANVVPVLVEAIKTLKQDNEAKLKQKEAEITELRAQLTTVLERLEKLEARSK
jgi:hypothetical protein